METSYSLQSRFIITAIVLLSLAAFWLIMRALINYQPPGTLPRHPPVALLEMNGVVLNGMDDGNLLWTLNAKKADISQDRITAHLYNITECKLLDKKKVVAKLHAKDAIFNLITRRLTMTGGVRIYSTQGQDLHTDAIQWNSATSILESSGKVIYHSRTGDVTAEKVRFHTKNMELILDKPRISVYMTGNENPGKTNTSSTLLNKLLGKR